jgi:type III restriction enzyme
MSNNNLFNALSSESRVRIIKKLINKETHLSQLSRELNISKPVISRHIRILEDAGIIERKIIGNVHLLSVNLECIEKAFEPFIEESKMEIEKNTTIFDALRQLPGVEIKSHGKNQYITSIDGEKGFYIYEVNETTPKKSINGQRISQADAKAIHYDFTVNRYIDENGRLTEKYHKDREAGEIKLRDDYQDKIPEIVEIVRELYENVVRVHNEDDTNKIRNQINKENFDSEEFRKLWDYINSKSTYTVDFNTQELIQHAINKINENLEVTKIRAETKEGWIKAQIKEGDFKKNTAFDKEQISTEDVKETISEHIKYDLIGKIVTETNLTRTTIIEILSKIDQQKFDLYKVNPEDFTIKISKIINDEKAEIIHENIQYHSLEDKIPIEIFEENIQNKGKFISLNKYIYDYLIYDSDVEKNIAQNMDESIQVSVFSKLPKGDYVIYTPVGKFSPDWMIVFDKDKVKYAYFVIETKGSTSSLQLRGVERIKIECAKKHFHAISSGNVKFDAVNGFDELMNKIELLH